MHGGIPPLRWDSPFNPIPCGGIGLKGQSQLLKGRPIYSNDCGKYSLCQLDHAQ